MSENEAAIVECVHGFVGPHGGARRHEKFRADDPIVLQAPHHFVAPDLPESEWPSVFDGVISAREQADAEAAERRHAERLAAAKQNRVRLDVGPLLRAKQDVIDIEEVRLVEKGSTVLADDPLVARFPDSFAGGT